MMGATRSTRQIYKVNDVGRYHAPRNQYDCCLALTDHVAPHSCGGFYQAEPRGRA